MVRGCRGPLLDEGEQVLLSAQRRGNAHEAVHTNRVDRMVRRVEVLFLKAVLAEPIADVRGQIRVPTMPRPNHHCALVAQLGSGGNGAVHILVGDVAEDPAQQDQIGGDGSEVGVAGPRIGAPWRGPGG